MTRSWRVTPRQTPTPKARTGQETARSATKCVGRRITSACVLTLFFHFLIGITFGSPAYITLFQVDNVFVPAVGDRDSDDLRQNASSPNPFPPEFYVTFLRNATIMEKIGAEARYSECPDAPFELFERTGDVREFVLYE